MQRNFPCRLDIAEGRGKKEEGRRKKEELILARISAIDNVFVLISETR
jgi:hypothetical protein